jgi:hypothetical protein
MVVQQRNLRRLDAAEYGFFGKQDSEAHLHARVT